MIDVLEFIFQSFWHFIGTLMILSVIFGALGRIGSKDIVINKDSEEKND